MLAPKAPVLMGGPPFTTQGYERAKILKLNFGQPSEVVKAHIGNLVSLPEKLATSAQSLESMGKLQNINGFVRHTLDKLSRIKSELVRSDDEWQERAYVQLVEYLKKFKH